MFHLPGLLHARALGRSLPSALILLIGTAHAASAPSADGVPTPKKHGGAVPPMGGAPLSVADLQAVSAYVWALGHSDRP
jgi:hypothetical protein